MNFPVEENTDGKCLVCGRDMNSKFVVLNAGCLRVEGPDEAGMFDKGVAECFMSLYTHNHDACDASVDIVDPKRIKFGQFDLYFCSFNCARDFFKNAVDDLEDQYKRSNERQEWPPMVWTKPVEIKEGNIKKGGVNSPPDTPPPPPPKGQQPL